MLEINIIPQRFFHKTLKIFTDNTLEARMAQLVGVWPSVRDSSRSILGDVTSFF